MINQSLHNAITKLWDSVNKSSEMLSSIRYENKTLVSQINQTVSDKEVVLDELRRTRDEINRLRGEFEQTSLKVLESTKIAEDFRQLETRYEAVENEKEEIKSLFTTLQNRNIELEQTISTLQLGVNAKDNLAKRADQLESENHTLSLKLGEMLEFEKNLEIMRRELARKNSDVNSHLNEVQRLKNERAEMESKLFEIPRQRDEITLLKQHVEQLTSERDELLKTHEEAHEYSRLHKIQQESIDSYSQQILDLKRLNGQLENEKNDKEKHIEILQRKIDEQTMTQERLHLQLRSAREYEQQISEQLKSLDDYSAQVIEMRKTITLRDEELIISRTNEKELQQLVQKEQQTIWVLNERIGSLTTNHEKLLLDISEVKSTNEKLTITLLELQEVSQKTVSDNSELVNECNNLKEQNETLFKKNSEFEAGLNVAITENEVLKSKTNALTIELHSAYEKLKSEENNTELLKDELNSNKEDTIQQLQKLNDEILNIKSELNEQIRTAAELELLNQNLLDKISDIESNYSQIKEALAAASSDLENLVDEKEKMLQEQRFLIEKLNNEHEIEHDNRSREKKELEQRINDLNNDKEIKYNEIVSLQSQLSVMTSERDEYLGQISSIVGEKEESIEMNESKLILLTDELKKIRSTGEEISEENIEFRRQIDILTKTLDERNAQLEQLREQLSTLSKDRSADEMQIRQKEKIINELANKLNAASVRIAQFSSAHAEASVSNHSISSNAWLRDENKNLHTELQSLTEEIIALRSDRDSVNAYNSTLTQEVKLLREQSENRESKIFAMKGELMRLKNQMTIAYDSEKSLSTEKERSIPNERTDLLASRIKQTVESLEKFL